MARWLREVGVGTGLTVGEEGGGSACGLILSSRPPPQKCLRLNPDVPIWVSKQRILCTLNHSLKDVLNYGLFQPAFNGRAGKFLDEERLLREYPLNPDTPVPYLEVPVCICFTLGTPLPTSFCLP